MADCTGAHYAVEMVGCMQARSQGGAIEAMLSPNSERCTKHFQGNQGFDA